MEFDLLGDLESRSQAMRPKSLGRRPVNMTGKVLAYSDAKQRTVTIEATSGPMAGEEMDIRVMKKDHFDALTNEANKDKQTSSFSPVGSIIRLDQVVENKEEERFEAKYAVSMVKSPDADNFLIPDVLTTVDTGSKRKIDEQGSFRRVVTLDAENETPINSFEGFKAALTEAFETSKGAAIIEVKDGSYRQTLLRLRVDRDKKYIPVEEMVDSLVPNADADPKKLADYKNHLEQGHMTVVPARFIAVQPKVNDEINKNLAAGKRIQSVPIPQFVTQPLGQRIEWALKQKDHETDEPLVSEAEAARFEAALDAFLPSSAKEAKDKNGFAGVSDKDLYAFFAKNDQRLIVPPHAGYQKANIAASHFTRSNSANEGDAFTARVQEGTYSAMAFPTLKCTEDLIAAYRIDLPRAIAAIGSPEAAKEAEDTRDADVINKKAEEKAVDMAAEAAAADEEAAQIDEANAEYLDSQLGGID